MWRQRHRLTTIHKTQNQASKASGGKQADRFHANIITVSDPAHTYYIKLNSNLNYKKELHVS